MCLWRWWWWWWWCSRWLDTARTRYWYVCVTQIACYCAAVSRFSCLLRSMMAISRETAYIMNLIMHYLNNHSLFKDISNLIIYIDQNATPKPFHHARLYICCKVDKLVSRWEPARTPLRLALPICTFLYFSLYRPLCAHLFITKNATAKSNKE